MISGGQLFRFADKYKAAVFLIMVSGFFFYHQIQRPALTSSDDIKEIEGDVQDYSFEHPHGFRGRLTQYYIWLDQYPCTFQIKADFSPFFKKSLFESQVQKGDRLKLSIPKEFENDVLEENENIFILSASDSVCDFLSQKATLEKENDHFDLYAGLFFLIVGFASFAWKKMM